ncbi:MAG: hypothetical protein A2605_03390 [Candidatus Zambryskibacteria bacterium RIFOXYD1_FULL_39_35]|nr:MAG: hypothetical protein A2605_03390 [Candidatus Zambryskibacteria bacterium RIFOXYD1_FULL_39_35]
MFKNISTLILKATVVVLGLIVIALCIFALPSMWKGGSIEFAEASYAVKLVVIGLYATTVPFFIALWQALKLLHYIRKDMAFSDLSVKALKNIKYSAIIIGVLYMSGEPLLFPIADADDAPGLVVIGFAIACAPFVIAAFANVFQKILQDGIEIKN